MSLTPDDFPTTFVCRMQSQVYDLKDALAAEEDKVEAARKALKEAEGDRDYAKRKLFEHLTVLDRISPDSADSEDWFQDHDYTREGVEEFLSQFTD